MLKDISSTVFNYFFLLGIFVFDSQVVQRLVEASVETGRLDSVQAILTVLGCMAIQGVQATHWE